VAKWYNVAFCSTYFIPDVNMSSDNVTSIPTLWAIHIATWWVSVMLMAFSPNPMFPVFDLRAVGWLVDLLAGVDHIAHILGAIHRDDCWPESRIDTLTSKVAVLPLTVIINGSKVTVRCIRRCS
jgi:hypothetical protein